MITRKTATVYVIMRGVIEFRESNSQIRSEFSIILMHAEERCIDQITSYLLNIRLIKLINLIKTIICGFIGYNLELQSNVITNSNFSHIAIC